MPRLFSEDPELEVWIENGSESADSKLLFTISNSSGTRTILVTPNTVIESEAKYFVDTPPERIVSKNQIRLKRATAAFRFVGYLLSAVVLTFAALSITGHVKARVVLTGSMAPTINPGDIVLLANPDRLIPEVGEVATYVGRRFSGEPVGLFTHRIIGGNAEEGFIMKGDANSSPDVQRPTTEDISGVVFFVIPFIGKILAPKVLTLLIPLIIGLWFIIDALRERNE